MLRFLTLFLFLCASASQAEDVREILTQYSHAQLVGSEQGSVVDYELGLDALQKRLGQWGFDKSVRVNGVRAASTYQLQDGFSASQLADELETVVKNRGYRVLFSCLGRDCGRAVQWANRVFQQRLLYGQENEQRYWIAVKKTDAGVQVNLAYASFRTEARQYLHLEVLNLEGPVPEVLLSP